MASGQHVEAIRLAVDSTVDAATAWKAITDPARIVEWFTEASELGPVGSPYRLDFGDGSIVGGTVLAIDPGHSFSHSWSWAGDSAAESTTVAWTVEAGAGGGSRILLEHDGWDAAGLEAAARDDHEAYWTGYLEDLAAVLGEA